jgi:hypothetical protein
MRMSASSGRYQARCKSQDKLSTVGLPLTISTICGAHYNFCSLLGQPSRSHSSLKETSAQRATYKQKTQRTNMKMANCQVEYAHGFRPQTGCDKYKAVNKSKWEMQYLLFTKPLKCCLRIEITRKKKG